MFLNYPGKKTLSEIYRDTPEIQLVQINNATSRNFLIEADNLSALKYLITHKGLAGRVDLIYIDPPFATNQVFTFTQERANTISNSRNGNLAYSDRLTGIDFIEFIRQRLVLLRELLSDEGSIYLHTDYKIGHYLKIIMDEVFGDENFRNDITRIKCNPKNFSRKAYGNIKDLILFYSKTRKHIWHEPLVPYSEEDKLKLFPKTDKDGRRYTTIPLHAPGETVTGRTALKFLGIEPPPGRHWRSDVEELEEWDRQGLIEWSSKGNPRKKIFLDEQKGKRVQDIWDFKDPQYPVYPTEKNLDMLRLIVQTSSNPDSLVLDCFAGSGTTLIAAHQLGRNWIGIDNSPSAIEIIQSRFQNLSPDLFTPPVNYSLFKTA